jgi:hypothetical protein
MMATDSTVSGHSHQSHFGFVSQIDDANLALVNTQWNADQRLVCTVPLPRDADPDPHSSGSDRPVSKTNPQSPCPGNINFAHLRSGP